MKTKQEVMQWIKADCQSRGLNATDEYASEQYAMWEKITGSKDPDTIWKRLQYEASDGAREAFQDGVASYLPLTDYAPNVTCPFCMGETNPAHGNETHWDGTTLTIQQTCPKCGHRWNEEWTLKSLRATSEDELPPSKW